MQDQASGRGAGGNGTSSYADSLTWTRRAGAALAATGLQATPTPSHGKDQASGSGAGGNGTSSYAEPYMDQASGSGAGGNGTSSYAEPYMDQASGSGAGGNGTSSYADSLTWTRRAGAALAATGLQATPTPSHGPGERERRWRQRDFKLRRLPHMDQASRSGAGGNGTSSYADSLTWTRRAGAALAATGLQATPTPSHGPGERERRWRQRDFKLCRIPRMDQASGRGAGGNGTSSYADSLTWTRRAGAALAATGLQATPTPSHGPGERERRWRQRDFKLRRLPHMDQASGSGAGGNGTSSYAELPHMDQASGSGAGGNGTSSYAEPYMDQASGSGAGGNGTSSYADSLTWARRAGAALAATGLQATPTPSHAQDDREREQTALSAATREVNADSLTRVCGQRASLVPPSMFACSLRYRTRACTWFPHSYYPTAPSPPFPLSPYSPSPPTPLSPLSPFSPFPPLPLFPSSPSPHLPPFRPHPPPATAPSARYLATGLYLAMGNRWEQLSKARLHLGEAMALPRHWGRTCPQQPHWRQPATWHALLCFPRAHSLPHRWQQKQKQHLQPKVPAPSAAGHRQSTESGAEEAGEGFSHPPPLSPHLPTAPLTALHLTPYFSPPPQLPVHSNPISPFPSFPHPLPLSIHSAVVSLLPPSFLPPFTSSLPSPLRSF
ncbi:unnamed protein product [Closterium sp. Yama58-4]|nr:unnamed protein product [Closterium sp. Yama58-4]